MQSFYCLLIVISLFRWLPYHVYIVCLPFTVLCVWTDNQYIIVGTSAALMKKQQHTFHIKTMNLSIYLNENYFNECAVLKLNGGTIKLININLKLSLIYCCCFLVLHTMFYIFKHHYPNEERGEFSPLNTLKYTRQTFYLDSSGVVLVLFWV